MPSLLACLQRTWQLSCKEIRLLQSWTLWSAYKRKKPKSRTIKTSKAKISFSEPRRYCSTVTIQTTSSGRYGTTTWHLACVLSHSRLAMLRGNARIARRTQHASSVSIALTIRTTRATELGWRLMLVGAVIAVTQKDGTWKVLAQSIKELTHLKTRP